MSWRVLHCAAVSLAIPLSAGRAQRAVSSDSLGTISGQVIDAASRRPLSLAAVSISDGEQRVISGLNGSFAIRVAAPGRYSLSVRKLGYEPRTTAGIVVAAGQTTRVTVELTAAVFRLSEVTVVPGSFSFLDAGLASQQTISREAIQSAPFGEDLFRAMHRVPGLTSGDYGAQFSIRGGRQDETLINLDGLEIHEPFHLKDFNEGALSIFDVEAIEGVELLTGGFPARYGDKRSGVMNITSRTPRRAGTHVTAGASLTNATLFGEGTFSGSRGSWLVSGRRGFFDVLLRTINRKETRAPAYNDVFGSLRYAINAQHALAFNVLRASDTYRFQIKGTTGFNDSIPTIEAADNRYGNAYAWLTLRSLLSEHLALNSLISVGSVTARREGDEHHRDRPTEYYGVAGRRDFSVYSVKLDFRYQRSNRVVMDWGYDLRSMQANYAWENRVTQNPDDPLADTSGYYPRITRRRKTAGGLTLAGYLSGRAQLLTPLTIEAGVRYDGATYSHDADVSPRLHLLLQLSERNSLRGGWGLYRQRQGIADENAFDRLNRYFPSELSQQLTLGLEHRYAGGGSIRAEVYRKTGSRLRPILRNWKSGLNVFPESSEDRLLVYPTSTEAQGLELFHDREFGKRLNVRFGYAYSKTTERVSRIESLNNRLKPPFDSTHAWPQDQRHALNLDATLRLGRNWSITNSVTVHSGWPYTDEIGVPVRRRNGTTDLQVRPDTLYGRRLPSYQRMDMRLTRRRQTTNGELRFFAEVINLTNRANVLGYDVFRINSPSGAAQLVRDPETWFSILPSIGVSWSRRW